MRLMHVPHLHMHIIEREMLGSCQFVGCLAERRLVVDAGAGVSVAACPNLEVEGTVDLVFLRPEDALKAFGHDFATLVI